jgi:hypothetical protein
MILLIIMSCEEGALPDEATPIYEEIASGWVSIRREEQERGYSTTSSRNDGKVNV